jgi:hypothetical protein
MAISDIVVEPVKQTFHGVGKGAKVGGTVGGVGGALAGGAVAFIPAVVIGGVAAVAGLFGAGILGGGFLLSGFLGWAATELVGALAGGVAGGAAGGIAGGMGGGLIGSVVGAFKGVVGFVEGIFSGLFGGKKKTEESDEVRGLRAQDAQMQAYLDQQRIARANAIASVGNPDAPGGNASRLAAQSRANAPTR